MYTTIHASQSSAVQTQKPYAKPTLTCYGTVRELTSAASTGTVGSKSGSASEGSNGLGSSRRP